MRFPVAVSAAALLLSAASPVLATNCITTVACVIGQNSSTGASSDIGVEGLSQHGFGLVGVTSANPSSSSGRVAGLYGKDQGPSPFNSGVSAFSQNGTGLIGFGINGAGVIGLTTAASSATAAVAGDDAGTNAGNAAVLGVSNVGTGVAAASTNGDAIEGTAQGAGLALNVFGGAQNQAAQIVTVGTGALLDGFNDETSSTGVLEFSFDGQGNEMLAGNLMANGSSYARTRSTTGTDVASYGARSASPTLEDFGQGSIRMGSGHVALDPTFASTIDTRNYLVFVTPHGDSHGLYTTISAGGFDVHENEQGHSTLTFDYRIVGKPLDMASAVHLPVAASLAQFRGAKAERRATQRPLPKFAISLKSGR